MAQIHKSAATLRIFGDSLIPDEITRLLGSKPTKATQKGEIILYDSGREQIARHGSWRLEISDCVPENLDHQISWILSQLTDDLEIWNNLHKKFRIDLFCGLFMNSSNEGFSLSSETILALGSRGIAIGFDIYDSQ